jgi:hypothetical protein
MNFFSLLPYRFVGNDFFGMLWRGLNENCASPMIGPRAAETADSVP